MMLDERTDQATRKMLQKVVERKQKFDKLEFQHLCIMWSTILVSFGYFLYLYSLYLSPIPIPLLLCSLSISIILVIYIMLMVVIGLFGFMNLYRQKRDKAEKEFHCYGVKLLIKVKIYGGKKKNGKIAILFLR